MKGQLWNLKDLWGYNCKQVKNENFQNINRGHLSLPKTLERFEKGGNPSSAIGASAALCSLNSTAMATAKTVKDVSPHEFVKAYAAHLKRSGKVSGFSYILCFFFLSDFLDERTRLSIEESILWCWFRERSEC